MAYISRTPAKGVLPGRTIHILQGVEKCSYYYRTYFKEDSLFPFRLVLLFTSFNNEFIISILRQLSGSPRIDVIVGFM